MCEKDLEIISEILEKERLFFEALDILSHSLLNETICDYLSALEEIKSDFLLPLKARLEEEIEDQEDLRVYQNTSRFSDLYWYFGRT